MAVPFVHQTFSFLLVGHTVHTFSVFNHVSTASKKEKSFGSQRLRYNHLDCHSDG